MLELWEIFVFGFMLGALGGFLLGAILSDAYFCAGARRVREQAIRDILNRPDGEWKIREEE